MASDFEAVVAVWREASTARRSGEPVPATRERRLRDQMFVQDAFLVVADDNATIIGMALGMQANASDGVGPPVVGLCHVSAVFVSPRRWGQGVGRSLMAFLFSQARRRGYDAAQLWTQADNRRAQLLYERLGFRRSGREHHDDLGELIVHYERSFLEHQPADTGPRRQSSPASRVEDR